MDGTKLKINGISPGEATVTVTDSAGGSVAIAVKVRGDLLGKLSVNAPEEITRRGIETNTRLQFAESSIFGNLAE